MHVLRYRYIKFACDILAVLGIWNNLSKYSGCGKFLCVNSQNSPLGLRARKNDAQLIGQCRVPNYGGAI